MKAFGQIRLLRVVILLVLALVAGLVSDLLHSDRVVFAPPVTTVAE